MTTPQSSPKGEGVRLCAGICTQNKITAMMMALKLVYRPEIYSDSCEMFCV